MPRKSLEFAFGQVKGCLSLGSAEQLGVFCFFSDTFTSEASVLAQGVSSRGDSQGFKRENEQGEERGLTCCLFPIGKTAFPALPFTLWGLE